MDDYAGALALKILEQISFHPQNDSEAKVRTNQEDYLGISNFFALF